MNKAEKSLRWVVNQIPDFKPTTNEEKMLVAIKLYSEAGAEEIKRLEAENTELKGKAQKLEEQLKAISDRTAKIPSLEQIEKRFLDWTIPFLKARITGCKEEWFGIDYITKAIWKFIKDDYKNAIAIDETNAALRERLEKAAELPYSHLEMLKLLTCAAICYAKIKNLIVARMAKSRDVADLFMESPTVQGTILDLALYRLSESNLNCNKIKGFEEVINATGSFKDYLAKAEARLKELQGGEE